MLEWNGKKKHCMTYQICNVIVLTCFEKYNVAYC
jgi:hypothetical protein